MFVGLELALTRAPGLSHGVVCAEEKDRGETVGGGRERIGGRAGEVIEAVRLSLFTFYHHRHRCYTAFFAIIFVTLRLATSSTISISFRGRFG